MIMKKVLLFTLILVILITFAITANADNPSEERAMVFDIPVGVPEGFIPFMEAVRQKQEEGILRIFAHDNQVAFLDSDGINIYHTWLNDERLFYIHERVRYINEEIFLNIVEIAKHAPEQRLRTYFLNEEIEIRGAGNKIYNVTITGILINELQFKITPNVSEEELRGIFDFISVESNDRLIVDAIEVINMETVRIMTSQEITAVILRNPEYRGLTYRVVLNNEETVPDELTTADALAILRHVAGTETLSSQDLARFGLNENEITTADALAVLRKVAGL
jgi:hypothetical protein